LSIIPAGPPSDNAQELLSSARFAAFVGQLLREYDLAIFDTTPSNTCTDAQRVATVVGYSLVVAHKDETYFDDVKALAELLRADKSVIVGTVLNDF
jgi:Mrp family chromosome partitioning ATPase